MLGVLLFITGILVFAGIINLLAYVCLRKDRLEADRPVRLIDVR